jgi:glycerol uptake facilitator-like aquaporin
MVVNPRALAAEALGTMFLLATVVGSGVMAERLAGGNVAVALLGNTIATGAMLYVLISLFGPISGAQFNPAVTLVLGPRAEFVQRLAVQIIAAILGVWLAHAMFEMQVLQTGVKLRGGPAQWLSEGVATFGLILTIILGERHRPAALPTLVALYIVAAYWFTASTSFANPAVTIARSLTDSFAGIRPADAPGFIAAQFAGAFLARAIAGLFAVSQK